MAYKLVFEEREEFGRTPRTVRTPGLGERRPLDAPALYFLGEILSLHKLSQKTLKEVHEAKLDYPGIRVLQDG